MKVNILIAIIMTFIIAFFSILAYKMITLHDKNEIINVNITCATYNLKQGNVTVFDLDTKILKIVCV